ncbi:hypothetical protein [Lactiplantibacillus plantarum]|uniref:hypothetical protein n=1 Tax=Lactiplantibacillus plantarum TaxID=1590 RepID=UPI0021A4BDED|nr:hypothetical protein [Lactiplantibacillus plantarum]MCT3231908.1 hypothetical protein [Lactiplantibacillus plantarum]MCT3549793.1 hypothetical protein [Lactiplantibacillus plantarum]
MSVKKTYKIFIKENTRESFIICFDANTENYYSLVKRERKKHNLQLIINSERYLNLFEKLSTCNNVDLTDVEFLEEDTNFSKKINQLIKKQDMMAVIREISLFNQYNDIDIQSVRLKGQVNNANFLITLQNNGVIISDLNNTLFHLENTNDDLRQLILAWLGLKDGER